MPKPKMESLFLSRRQASELLGVSEQTIDRLLIGGPLTKHKIGSKVLVPRAQVMALAAKSAEVKP